MEKLRENALSRFIPLVRENTGKALQEQCKLFQPKNILEIGTAIGYSALLMLCCCEANICTLEKNEERLKEAKENFEKYNVSGRVETMLGDASDSLIKLIEMKRKFDFVFLDGPKGQYIHYYPKIKELLNVGGVLFADNVKLLGLVENTEKVTHKNRSMTRNMTNFIQTILEDCDFETQLFDVEDGYLIAKKIR